jgi:hypothetical protein
MVKGAGPYMGSKIKMASAVDFSTKKLFSKSLVTSCWKKTFVKV